MLKGLGGMGDMMGLMKQAQKMKKDMKKIKKDISKTNITVSDKNNMITLVINGDYVVQKITLTNGIDVSDIKKLELLMKDKINLRNNKLFKIFNVSVATGIILAEAKRQREI